MIERIEKLQIVTLGVLIGLALEGYYGQKHSNKANRLGYNYANPVLGEVCYRQAEECNEIVSICRDQQIPYP